MDKIPLKKWAIIFFVLIFVFIGLEMFVLRIFDILKLFLYVAYDFTHCVDTNLEIQKADTIISSLDTYYKDHGAYPESLHDLNPKYITNIPNLTRGDDFFYYSQNFSSYKGAKPFYQLSFYDCAMVSCKFDSDDKKWRCDD